MTRRITHMATVSLLVAHLGLAQQAPQKQVKKQQEFDLYNAARNEQDPAKKLHAVDEWKAVFPDTDFRGHRNLFYPSAYLGLQANALKPNTSAESPASGAKAAQHVLDPIDAIFSAAIKPAYPEDADWNSARQEATTRSHWTLAAVSLNRKDFPAEEAELVKFLMLSPRDANAALMLSRAIIAVGRQNR